jgi:hypothetical protein
VIVQIVGRVVVGIVIVVGIVVDAVGGVNKLVVTVPAKTDVPIVVILVVVGVVVPVVV